MPHVSDALHKLLVEYGASYRDLMAAKRAFEAVQRGRPGPPRARECEAARAVYELASERVCEVDDEMHKLIVKEFR